MTLDALSSVPSEEYTTHDMLVVLSLTSTLGTSNWEKVAATASKGHLPFYGGSPTSRYTSQECERIYGKALQVVPSISNIGSKRAMLDAAISRLKDLRLSEIQMRLKSINDVLNHSIVEQPVSVISEAKGTKSDASNTVNDNAPINESKSPLSLDLNKELERVKGVGSADNEHTNIRTTKRQPSASPSIQAAEVYTTPKEDAVVEEPAESSYIRKGSVPRTVGEDGEDGESRPASENSSMAGCHEKKLARKAATTVYSQGNAPETKGSVIPEPVGVGIETQNIIDEQPPVGWTDKSNDTAAYGRNDNVKLKLNEDLEGERETLAKVEPETDSRQRGHRREQAPELVVEIEPKPGLILESEIETSLDVTKNKRRDSEYETTNDVEGSAARPGGVISGPARDYVNKTAPVTPTIDEQQLKNWKKNITMVWRELSGHRFGSMFIGPIKSADAPNYYDVIRKPMDLKTIKNRVRDEEITTTAEFYCDVMHMLMNALMYNAEDTEVYQMAMEFIPDAQACIEQLLQTEEEAVKHPAAASNGNGNGGGDMADSNMPGVDVLAGSTTGAAVRTEDDARSVEHHDEDDSDASSVPAKRRRRVASERASKHLRI